MSRKFPYEIPIGPFSMDPRYNDASVKLWKQMMNWCHENVTKRSDWSHGLTIPQVVAEVYIPSRYVFKFKDQEVAMMFKLVWADHL